MTPTHKTSCGEYQVWHTGKCAYVVKYRGMTMTGFFRSLSEAHNYASRCHHADRHCAAHAVSLEDPAELHNAIKNAVGE